ncbi:hypothetical protein Q1695_002913 [Nippostrongylus brasiliensis]|nr:hypothetical protein Q1695_002913 [Nippostrongylus brasiliensis]
MSCCSLTRESLWNITYFRMPIQLDAVYQEQVNKRVLQEYVRIVGLKFKKNSNYDVVLSEFADKILE